MHRYQPPWPGAPRSLPCALCGKRESPAHDQPLRPGARLDHSELLRRIGRCDGSCGRHAGRPLTHNDRITLFGRCDIHPACRGVPQR